jgi:hypothetical protein
VTRATASSKRAFFSCTLKPYMITPFTAANIQFVGRPS